MQLDSFAVVHKIILFEFKVHSVYLLYIILVRLHSEEFVKHFSILWKTVFPSHFSYGGNKQYYIFTTYIVYYCSIVYMVHSGIIKIAWILHESIEEISIPHV